MELSILKTDGTTTGRNIELDDTVFGIEPNDTVIYEAVRSYLANQRQGTASTKGRSEVRGGGRKAFRQKGTGGARRGTMRSPLLKGGGTVHGPEPRDYMVRMTKKQKQLARRSALSYKAKDSGIVVVEDFNYDVPKTKNFVSMLSALKLDGKKVLVITNGTQLNVYKAGRNLPKVAILEATKPSTYEILHADVLLIQESALAAIENNLNGVREVEA
jgi:large subunit ribosomal protein L4